MTDMSPNGNGSGATELVDRTGERAASSEPSAVRTGESSSEVEIVLIGDSIRMGYQEVVRHLLRETARIWAPEENGGDSTNVLRHLDDWVFCRRPSIVHLNCGLHDIKRPFESLEPAVPIEKYESNLREIFRRLRRESAARIVWASTTPVNEALHNANKDFNRFEADVAERNEAAAGIAREFGIPVDDLFATVMGAGRDRLLTEDGVHFTEEGCRLLGTAVAGFLKPFIVET